jgi:hypothetical protein
MEVGMSGLSRCKVIVSLLFASLFLSVSMVEAWEFSVMGKYTWEYQLYSQLGSKGFFGPYDRDNSTVSGVVNLAARNGWLGNEITGDNLASGSDVSANYMYSTLYPKVKLNEALSVEGSYRIGSWANPFPDTSLGQLNYSRYLNSQAYGVSRSFSPGYWNTLFLTAQLPWGVINVGKMPIPFGAGFFIDGSDETTAEALTLTVPYGPLAIALYYYPWRRGQFIDYPLITDKNNVMQPDVGGFLLFNSGNLSVSTLCEYWNMHWGPESQLRQSFNPVDSFNPGRANFRPTDITVLYGMGNLKYTNGRFFFNTEVAFWQQTTRNNRSESNLGLAPQTTYWEFWGGMTEFGVISGPAKLSLMWAYYPGYDRRAGVLIDRQPTVPSFFLDGGVSTYRPYSLLLSYNYGSGNGSKTYSSNHGFMTDASSFGARLDYAVAANLNAYASGFYAERVSQAYGWGWIRPDPSTTPTSPAMQYAFRFDRQGRSLIAYIPGTPNILERDLGYEIGAGFDWKLLEGLALHANFAYWQPGGWFKFACVDRTQPGWDVPVAGNNYGINPNRAIDPVFGSYISLETEF